MSEIFIIPIEPPQDEHGFVLLPVMPEGSVKSKSCNMCNGGCKPDRHHAYWPKPARKKRQSRERTSIYGEGLPDFSKDPYDKLRSAPFSISNLICRGWHDALHNLQSPPSHLPDTDIVQLALGQYQYIINLAGRVAQLSALTQQKPVPGNPRVPTLVESVRLGVVNFPKEVVTPTIGYYCLRANPKDGIEQSDSPPIIFEPHRHLNDAQIALGRATKMLEDSN